MGGFFLGGCAAVGVVVVAVGVAVCLYFVVRAAGAHLGRLVAVWRRRRAGLAGGRERLEDMPAHPEQLADVELADLMEARYWDVVGRLLEDQARARDRRAR
ncbi:hypothetical protein GCM10022254_09260 [Actinomadura meridiana]|uniref:Secreted protein n=1 Tax=Actinomadura meridiana TaxID=559626 RepID=A0ABP8BTN8_9ACTN